MGGHSSLPCQMENPRPEGGGKFLCFLLFPHWVLAFFLRSSKRIWGAEFHCPLQSADVRLSMWGGGIVTLHEISHQAASNPKWKGQLWPLQLSWGKVSPGKDLGPLIRIVRSELIRLLGRLLPPSHWGVTSETSSGSGVQGQPGGSRTLQPSVGSCWGPALRPGQGPPLCRSGWGAERSPKRTPQPKAPSPDV